MIQATALAYLSSVFEEKIHWVLKGVEGASIIEILFSFQDLVYLFWNFYTLKSLIVILVIIITWNEYVMGASGFIWIPRVFDSIIPFALGGIEFLLIHSIFLNPQKHQIFFELLCVFWLMGFLAYWNMFGNAKKFGEQNLATFNAIRLSGKAIVYSYVWGMFFLFGSMAILIHKGLVQSENLLKFFLLSSLMLHLLFLGRANKYWKSVVELIPSRKIVRIKKAGFWKVPNVKKIFGESKK